MQLDDDGKIIVGGSKVQLLPYQPRAPIPFELMTDDELLAGVGGTLIVDTESYPNYWLCAFRDVKTKKVIRLEPPFDPRKLSWIMHSYKTVGFNSIKYDLAMIWAAFQNQDPEFLKSVSNALINNMWRSEAEKEFGFKIYPTSHVDLIEVAPLTGSLKLYGARLHSPRIQDLPFEDTKYLSDEEKEIVANYCIGSDLPTTELLFNFMKERLELRADISMRYKEDVMSKSDAQIAEAVICKEIMNRTGKYPKKSEIKDGYTFKYDKPSYIQYATPDLQKLLADILECDFVVEFGNVTRPPALKDRTVSVGKLKFKFGIGGLHSCEECIAYKADAEYSIKDRDVTSYYPDIILTLGLYPENIGPVFLDIFRGFKNERVNAKRNKQFTYDKGLKIFINGTSGKLNQQFSRLYSPKSYIQMTLTGQLSILMLVEILVCNGFEVISGNTDGIVIYCKNSDEEKLNYWIKLWEDATQFKTEETQYSAYYAQNVNSYFALKLDGSVKVKGSYAEVGSQSGTQLDTNCATLICSDAIKNLLSKGMPIEKTIMECKDITRFVEIRNVKGGAHKDGRYLGKVIRWAYFKNEIGTINYVTTNNKVANTDNASPLMDLPEVFPTNINYQWYIDKANEILYDIGYYQRPKQVSFF